MDVKLMMQPLHDTIVVKPDPPQKHALLILPDEEVFTGTVVAVGPGKKLPNGRREPMWVAPGDRVQYSGTVDKQHDGMLLMKRNDLIGLVDG